MKRKTGYYRAKYHDKWLIVLYIECYDSWYCIGDVRPKQDDDFSEINETPINPNPKKYENSMANIKKTLSGIFSR